MYESGFQCLTKSDEEFLFDCYMERVGNRDGISIVDFKEIVLGFDKFVKNQSYILEQLEKIKKKMKERQVGISDHELVIRKINFIVFFLVL